MTDSASKNAFTVSLASKTVGCCYLLNWNTSGFWNQEVGEEDGHKLPEAKEDVDSPLEGAQHVQESCIKSQKPSAC